MKKLLNAHAVSLLMALSACLSVSILGSNAAVAAPATPPSGEQLWGTSNTSLEVQQYSVPGAEVVATGSSLTSRPVNVGYDPSTHITWVDYNVNTDCILQPILEDGTLGTALDLQAINSNVYPNFNHCLAFLPKGDGTAYISGRNGGGHGTALLWIVNLQTGVLSSPVSLDYANALGTTSAAGQQHTPLPSQDARELDGANGLEVIDLSFDSLDPSSPELWAVGYYGYLYRLNPTTGAIYDISDDYLSLTQDANIWSALGSIAFDANGVLWASLERWDEQTWADPTQSSLISFVRSTDPQTGGWAVTEYNFFSTNSADVWATNLWFTPGDSASLAAGGTNSGAATTLADTGTPYSGLNPPFGSLATLAFGLGGLALVFVRISNRTLRKRS